MRRASPTPHTRTQQESSSNSHNGARLAITCIRPLTLVQAAGLSRLHEEKLADQHRPSPSPTVLNPTPFSSQPLQLSAPTHSPSPPLLPSPPKPPLPLKRLTPAEMAHRQEHGLCFNCNEKYTRGHRCASRFYLLIADEEKLDADTDPNLFSNDLSPKNPDP